MARSSPTHRVINVPPMESLGDVQQILSQKLQELQTYLIGALPITDYGGTRLVNIGNPIQAGDAVNLQYLQAVLLPQVRGQILNESKGGTNIFTGGADGPISTVVPIGISTNVIPNVAAPFGRNQRVALGTATWMVRSPIGILGGQSFNWNLIIDQDGTGGRQLLFDPTYVFLANPLGQALPNTRSVTPFITDQAGNTFLAGVPVTDQPIP